MSLGTTSENSEHDLGHVPFRPDIREDLDQQPPKTKPPRVFGYLEFIARARRQHGRPTASYVQDLPVDNVLTVFPLETKYGISNDAGVCRVRGNACNDEPTPWMEHFLFLLQRVPAKRRGTVSGAVLTC